MNTEPFFSELVQRVRDYGRYALAIQNKVVSYDKGREGESPSVRALTDADFMVQEGLLRFFIERNAEFSVFAEEKSPYLEKFQKDSEFRIGLDPIDGTLTYRLGLPGFCIVVGVHRGSFLEGAMVHTPFDGKVYCATQANPKSWIWEGDSRTDYDCSNNDSRLVLASSKTPADIKASMEREGFILTNPDSNPGLGLNSLLRGEIGGFFRTHASGLDWGPIAFIVDKGGGLVSDYEGKRRGVYQFWNRPDGEKEGHTPYLVAGGNPNIHSRLVNILKNEGKC